MIVPKEFHLRLSSGFHISSHMHAHAHTSYVYVYVNSFDKSAETVFSEERAILKKIPGRLVVHMKFVMQNELRMEQKTSATLRRKTENKSLMWLDLVTIFRYGTKYISKARKIREVGLYKNF